MPEGPDRDYAGVPETASAADPSALQANLVKPRPSRRVLVLAYYFPPMGLSGVQRTAKFVKYLDHAGWDCTVLTCDPGGYFAFDQSLLKEIEDAGVDIIRTRGWDPTRLFKRHSVVPLPEEQKRRRLSLVSQFFFLPDNKIGWLLSARKAGLQALKTRSIDLIFSTAPPYTSHLVGRSLAARTGLPLVLDFRDDWIGNPRHVYPTPLHRSISKRLERRVLRSADRVVVINEYIRRNLLSRNKNLLRDADIDVITQGFDPDDFQRVSSLGPKKARFTLLYSGVFYDVQTPEYFLRALADLISRRTELRGEVDAVFVGLLPESANRLVTELHLTDVVRHTGYLPHDDVIAQLCAADAVWMTVGRGEGAETISTSKLFEYFGSRKPILGLVPAGAARDALEAYGAAEIVEPDAVPEISAAIARLHEAWKLDRPARPKESVVEQYDRSRLALRLGSVFDTVVAKR